MGLAGHHLIAMLLNADDPRRAAWSGAGGAIGDPQVRERRGTVRRSRRWFPRLRARLARAMRR